MHQCINNRWWAKRTAYFTGRFEPSLEGWLGFWAEWSLLNGGIMWPKAHWYLDDDTKPSSKSWMLLRHKIQANGRQNENTAVKMQPDRARSQGSVWTKQRTLSFVPGTIEMFYTQKWQDSNLLWIRWILEAIVWQQEDPVDQGKQWCLKSPGDTSSWSWTLTGIPVVCSSLVLLLGFLQTFIEPPHCSQHSWLHM